MPKKEKVLVSWVTPRTDYHVHEYTLKPTGPNALLQNERLRPGTGDYSKHFWLASWGEDHDPKDFPGINAALTKHVAQRNKAWPNNPIELHHISLKNPIDVAEIYFQLEDFYYKELANYQVDISASLGTPQMQAAWYILAFYQGSDHQINLYEQPDPRFNDGKFAFNRIEKYVDDRQQALLQRQKEIILPYSTSAPFYLIDNMPSLTKVREVAHRISKVNDATALLRGETGVGKTVLAYKIHQDSDRRNKPFRAINCAGLSDELLHSELFGHEVGAYTGAGKKRKGLFQEANGGTVFLDEIGDISPKFQSTLLTALDRKGNNKMTIKPLGADRTTDVDVRVIAATNKDLRKLCQQGDFRWDLFYRLSVVELTIPPLRQRKSDIQTYINYFLEEKARQWQIKQLSLEPEALRILKKYPFPGNLRELRNIVEHFYVMCDQVIRVQDLPDYLLNAEFSVLTDAEVTDWNLNNNVWQFKKSFVAKALSYFETRKEAAQQLGLKSTQTIRDIEKYQLDRNEPNP